MTFKFKLERTLSSEEKIKALKEIANLNHEDVDIGENVEIIGNKIEIGRGVIIEKGVKLVFDNAVIGDFTRIGKESDIRATQLILESGTTLGHDMRCLVGEQLRIGRNAYIGHSCELICRNAKIDEGFYAEHGIIIGGGGGSTGPCSELKIGRFVHLGEFSVLNTARPLTIEDEAGLGAHVMIYTHGMWSPVLEGYPVNFGQVHIGSKAWITGRSIIMPGVSVGEGTVVAMGSVVTKDLPPRSLAGGVPAKVLREGLFDHKLSFEEQIGIVREILERYIPELEFKGFTVEKDETDKNILLRVDNSLIAFFPNIEDMKKYQDINMKDRLIILGWSKESEIQPDSEQITLFDLNKMKMSGYTDELSEDLRDFLRRNCIRFYTQDKFRSIQPRIFSNLSGV